MKRLLCIVLTLLLTISLVGCQDSTDKPQSTVTVYYKAANISYGTQDGVLAPFALDSTGHENEDAYLLNLYLSYLPSEAFSPTFPEETHLVSLNLDGLTARIILSDSFASLKGLNLMIACACLTRTVISLTGCQEVIISAESMRLDGNNYITLSSDSYLLLDQSAG